MTPEELVTFNERLNRIKEIREPIEAAYIAATLDENWELAAKLHNRLNQLQHLENKLRYDIK